MTYRAVGFDWGGVLQGAPGMVFVQAVCDLLGITPEQYRDAYFKHNDKVHRGELTWREFWKLVLTEELGQPDKLEGVMELSNSLSDATLNQEVVDLVDKLRAAGFRTGLLSNNTVDNYKIMEKSGLPGHFDVVHISALTGLVKPDPATFRHFAADLGIKTNELIYIDDSQVSLSTAVEVGYTPILFETYGQLVEQLRKLGIKV